MATLGAVGDILTAGATLWYAPVGTAFPDETSVAKGADWGGSWDQLTVLSDPLTLEYDETHTEAHEQDTLSAVERWVTAERHTLRTATMRMTGELMALLTRGTNADTSAGASQKAFSRVVGGGNPIITKYAIGFEGYRPDDTDGTLQPVRWFYHKASFHFDRGLMFSKEDKTRIPFVIHTYADPSQSEGEELYAMDIVTDQTT